MNIIFIGFLIIFKIFLVLLLNNIQMFVLVECELLHYILRYRHSYLLALIFSLLRSLGLLSHCNNWLRWSRILLQIRLLLVVLLLERRTRHDNLEIRKWVEIFVWLFSIRPGRIQQCRVCWTWSYWYSRACIMGLHCQLLSSSCYFLMLHYYIYLYVCL